MVANTIMIAFTGSVISMSHENDGFKRKVIFVDTKLMVVIRTKIAFTKQVTVFQG